VNASLPIIYLLGAGRSGTTLLATILNSHPHIHTLGEMHQFLDYYRNNKPCACGQPLDGCEFWAPIVSALNKMKPWSQEEQDYIAKCENHAQIPRLLLFRKPNLKYLQSQETIFQIIFRHLPAPMALDSSKYLARYILLSRSRGLELKGIYLVRDVRGVIHSFSKRVQTQRSAWSSIIYYMLINTFAEILYRLDRKIIKIRYEDLMQDPQSQVESIYRHLFKNDQGRAGMSKNMEIPHIVGGNRMKSESRIQIRYDDAWKRSQKRWKQIVYYFVAWPIMLLNRYKL